jgi:SAM-dependent methyltransferase
MGELQERVFDETYDYGGDPHLAHPELRFWIVDLVARVTARTISRRLPPRVLEIGAGDGQLTEALLARGFEVTATEVSRRAIDRLEDAFSANPNFTAVYDPAGDGAGIGDSGGLTNEPFSVVLCASVLHHIPDYLRFVEKVTGKHLRSEGAFVSVQDPLRYDTMSSFAHRFDRAAYLTWRLGRGNRLSGLVSLRNRLTGRLDPSRPGDMVEYHVVRNGVDENALRALLEKSFEEVRMLPYWSNQSRLALRLGRRMRFANQFALVAEGAHRVTQVRPPCASPRETHRTSPRASRVSRATVSQV